LLLVTDGRVLVTKKRAFGTWHVKDEVPAPDIVGVELEKRWLTLRVRVRARDAKDLTMKVRHNGRADEVVALLHHLLACGASPPPSSRSSAKGTYVTGGGSPMAGWCRASDPHRARQRPRARPELPRPGSSWGPVPARAGARPRRGVVPRLYPHWRSPL